VGIEIGAVRKEYRTPLSHFPLRLTDERVAQILEYPEMNEMGAELECLLTAPQIVRRSRSDHTGYSSSQIGS
jgi:hypothetical protein